MSTKIDELLCLDYMYNYFQLNNFYIYGFELLKSVIIFVHYHISGILPLIKKYINFKLHCTLYNKSHALLNIDYTLSISEEFK